MSTAPSFADWIRPGDRVTWGQGAAEPLMLTRALMEQRRSVGGRFSVFLGLTSSNTLSTEFSDCVDFTSYCGSGANRFLAEAGVLDILPCPYSQLPHVLTSGPNKVDVLLLQAAPSSDSRSGLSLSVSHEYLLPLIDTARVVIAEVNAMAPWTYGERELLHSDVDHVVVTAHPLAVTEPMEVNETDVRIARNVASLIEDGATLQVGIGAIPEAVLSELMGHRALGIHSGTIGDGVAELLELGVVTNERKGRDRGLTIAGTMMGTQRVHTFAHRNPGVQFRSTLYTHDARVLASLDKLVAINSAVEVDLTGQVNAEQVAGRYVGAVGGAPDFLRGAARSRGGLPIIAMRSRAGRRARIVAELDGPVSTPRCDDLIVVTEFGIADLRGLSLRQRARRLIDIAHPDDRAHLEQAPLAQRRLK